MKTFYTLLKTFAIVLIISTVSCNSLFKDDEQKPELEYLVHYELEGSLLSGMIRTLFDGIVENNPEMEEVGDRIRYGIRVYTITYRTTFEGEPIIASGLVSIPLADGTFPMISYQNGTNTLHRNAPTENPQRDLYLILQTVASTGFVISLPDYLGFGATDGMFHPYMHKTSTVPVVIDMLRAVKELGRELGFEVSRDLYLTGYSKGGWATLQVQKEIEARHSGEFNLKASAPSSGPYDLKFTSDFILNQPTYSMPYFLGFVFNSYSNLEEIETPLNEVFNSPYDDIVSTLFNGSLSGEEINEHLTADIPELFTANFLANRDTDPLFASVLQAFNTNSVDSWSMSTPTKLIHSSDDELVPFEASQKMYQDLIDAGTPDNLIELVPLPGYSHTDGIIPAGFYALSWFFEIADE